MMRTESRVHTPEERLRSREKGERRARVSGLRLLMTTAFLRTVLTRLLPLCGSAGWWVTPLCLLPGMAVYALLTLCLRRMGVSTLTEAVRACLGQAGAVICGIVVAVVVWVEALTSLTALLCLFTEGIGSRVPSWLLAGAVAVVLLLCLKEDGLPRGIHLMRWVLLLTAAVLAIDLASLTQVDGLTPWLGGGRASVIQAVRVGLSLGWPMILLLELPPTPSPACRTLDAAPPVLLCAVAALLVCLAVPHELLTFRKELIGAMILPAAFLRPLNRTLTLCLWMLALSLSAALSCQLAAVRGMAPTGRRPAWLPGVLLVGAAACQLVDASALWSALEAVTAWLLAPFAVLAAVLLPVSFLRRKQRA